MKGIGGKPLESSSLCTGSVPLLEMCCCMRAGQSPSADDGCGNRVGLREGFSSQHCVCVCKWGAVQVPAPRRRMFKKTICTSSSPRTVQEGVRICSLICFLLCVFGKGNTLLWCLLSRCAGICIYEGRGGMCSIRLSEPLLKLRPRKDLVEVFFA
jgi:hypothetical protein